MFAILSLVSFMFSLELFFYSIVIVYALCVISLGKDLAPLIPLFPLCYIAVSTNNNPGISDQGIFYGVSGNLILCLAAIVIVALIMRISFDKKIGWKLFFTKRRVLLPGLLLLSVAYFISGIGSAHYFDYVKSNVVFAFLQAMSILLLYFVFSATVRWDEFNVDYFAWAGLASGLVVVFELIWVYISENVVVDGVIDRMSIVAGWGTYNNMGAIIASAVPFAFYFVCKKRNSALYLLLALFLMIGILFSCSRSSIFFAFVAFIISYIYSLFKAKNKKGIYWVSAFIAVLAVLAVVKFSDKMLEIFATVPFVFDVVDGDVIFNDSGRLDIYIKGWNEFLKNPIFGQTFYSANSDVFDFSEVAEFSAFFPSRWHNTIIQLLASCGVVGLLAYCYHRYQTIRLFVKKRTTVNVYIGIYIVTLLGMSLLDCHFFNVGPVLFYSIALAVMEYGKSMDKV